MCHFIVYWFFMYFVSHATLQEQAASYEGAQVWQSKLSRDADIKVIQKLVEDKDISLWAIDAAQAEFLVLEDKKVKVNRLLNARKLNHTVQIMDVQRRIDSLKMEPALWNEKTLRIGHRLNWKEYPTFTIIEEYLVYLADNFPSICELKTIGQTAEKRAIKMIKISNGNPDNTAILITAGAHAREWVGITSALYVLDKIVAKFDHMPRYMKNIEWIIVPVLNPDGFVFSHTHDRLWRKNRRIMKKCIGVDINRNFEIDWDIVGVSEKSECSEGFSGPHAFSEAESIAIRNMIMSSKKKPSALLDLHSYSQLILYPWSGRPNPTKDKILQWTTAKAMSQAFGNSSGTRYKYGDTYHLVYPANGAFIDWLYASGTTQAFAVELRDTGQHGFLLPPNEIEPTGKELMAAVKELAKGFDPDIVLRHDDSESWF